MLLLQREVNFGFQLQNLVSEMRYLLEIFKEKNCLQQSVRESCSQ